MKRTPAGTKMTTESTGMGLFMTRISNNTGFILIFFSPDLTNRKGRPHKENHEKCYAYRYCNCINHRSITILVFYNILKFQNIIVNKFKKIIHQKEY